MLSSGSHNWAPQFVHVFGYSLLFVFNFFYFIIIIIFFGCGFVFFFFSFSGVGATVVFVCFLRKNLQLGGREMEILQSILI